MCVCVCVCVFVCVCRVVGPSSALPQASVTQGSRMWEVDPTYPRLSQGGCWAVGKPQDTVLRVGKHSLRCGKTRAGSGVLRPVTRLEPWGSLTLGHPGITGGP